MEQFGASSAQADVAQILQRCAAEVPQELELQRASADSCRRRQVGEGRQFVSVLVDVVERPFQRRGPRRRVLLPQQILMWTTRSEEHTSELQSRENLVCRLL